MKRLVESLGGRLDRVVIGDLRDNTYFATLHLAGADGKEISIDARPSDAIALALRLHGPILVADEVFAKSRAAQATPAAAHLWGLTVQDLTPEIAAFFKAAEAKGVLVSDVGDDSAAHEALRGDVITALDGEPVHSVVELADRAGAHAASKPVRLSLRRGARELTISFSIDASAAKAVEPLDPRLAGCRAGRRAHMEDIFTTLTSAGVARSDLYLAWDFTWRAAGASPSACCSSATTGSHASGERAAVHGDERLRARVQHRHQSLRRVQH